MREFQAAGAARLIDPGELSGNFDVICGIEDEPELNPRAFLDGSNDLESQAGFANVEKCAAIVGFNFYVSEA